jgi:hypothetical protein
VIPGTDEVAEAEQGQGFRVSGGQVAAFHDREGFGTAESTKSFAIIEIPSEITVLP